MKTTRTRSRAGLQAAAILTLLAVPMAAADPAPTADDARAFLAAAEEKLLDLWIQRERAQWVQSTYITYDTELLAARANETLIATTVELATEATRFDGLELPPEVARKLKLLKLALTLPAPADPAKTAELTQIAARMEGTYGRGEYCPEAGGECLDISEITNIMAESRDAAKLLEVWRGWHQISTRGMRDDYTRFVELANEGARELGFADVGAMWRANYDMEPAAFAAELDRLWKQVKPLYDQLHCYVRAELAEQYGTDVVPPDGPIPAHLLGNLWQQQWGNIYPLVEPQDVVDSGYDLTERLQAAGYDARKMVETGEAFFTSLGFEPLPETFWERSILTKPADRDVVCHASAWSVDQDADLRIKMCIQINEEDFSTIHHELGHNFYQRLHNQNDPLFRNSANDGFHEALGDTIGLSVTPDYLKRIGLIETVPPAEADIPLLLRTALDKVAFLPFGLIIDQWRWKVFSGEIGPDDYNRAWWELKRKYQGVAPVEARGEEFFDPGAKYHVPANVPYMRYFLAHILQFQFHRALAETAGAEGPLHRASIHGSAAVGERMAEMMKMGSTRPWPEALEVLTGQEQMDASAILAYFAPLEQWLERQNEGRKCGW
jgi:peptidyl-dipeptidase A